ncbi:MAG: hypothetical protein ABSG50_05410 [Opitutaceae bacterium]
MKIVRDLLVVIAGVILAAILVVIVAFMPAVQRWVVLKAAAGRPGLNLTVERLAIRPGSLTIHNLRLDQPGAQVALADATAELSLWEVVAHRRVIIHQASVAGLKMDLTSRTHPVPAPGGGSAPLPEPAAKVPATAAAPTSIPRAAPRPAAFDGVFKYLHLPLDVVLEKCRLDAEVVFSPARGKPPVHLRLKLTGGHFAPGQEAKFDFDAIIQNPDSHAPVDKVEAQGTLTATLDPRSGLERIGAHLEAVAGGPLLPAPARLQADVRLARTAAGEAYALTLNSLEAGVENRLLGLNIDYVAGSARLTGSWQVQASQRQVAPFVLGVMLPEFSAVGEGRFEMNSATRDVRLAGRFAGEVNQLEIIDPRLRELGRLSTATTFDLEYGGGHVRVSELVASISGRKPVLSLQAIQPFAIDLTSHKLVTANPEKELLQVNIEGVPLAWARPFASTFEVAGDEVRGGFVASLHGGRVWLRTTSPLAVRGLAVTRAGRVLLPASDISVLAEVEHSKEETRIRLEGLTLETATDDRLNARGEVSIKSGAVPATTLQASFEAILPTLLSAYAPIGPVEARGAVAGSQSGGTIQIDRLDAHLLTPEGRPLLELSSAEAFHFNIAQWNIAAVSGRSGELLRVKFGRVPLNLLQPYLGALELAGDLLPGELWVRTEGGTLHAAAAAPLRVEKLTAGEAGRAWVRDLTVEIEPVVDCSTQGVTARMTALRVRNAVGATLLSAQAEATVGPDLAQPKVRGAATFDLSVPALAAQPFMAGYTPPAQGRMSGEVKFSLDHDLLGEGQLTLNGLVSPATREPLPVANLSFRAGLGEKGDVAVQMPLLIDRSGERSDLTVAATLHPVGSGRSLDAKISSQHFVIDDALALVRAFAAPITAAGEDKPAGPPARTPEGGGMPTEPRPLPPAAAVSAPAKPPADASAAWAGLTGQVVIDLKSLAYGRNNEITGFTGRIAIDPQRLAVEKVTGKLGADGQLLLNAEARFAAGAPQPYTSQFDLNIKDLEVGPLFKADAPGKPPTVEGRFNVRSQAEGTGRTLVDLAEHTRGDFVLQSRKGVFRGLQRAAAVSRTANIVSEAARLLGLEGKVGGLVSSIDLTAELAGTLAELPFDQLNVRLSRDQSLNVKLSDFTLVSPTIRLQGDGQITHDPGKSLFDQALQLRVNMGVMGTVETKISRAKLPVLSGERDELGYMKLREPFVIGGTLAKPDANQLYSMLGRSLAERLLP